MFTFKLFKRQTGRGTDRTENIAHTDGVKKSQNVLLKTVRSLMKMSHVWFYGKSHGRSHTFLFFRNCTSLSDLTDLPDLAFLCFSSSMIFSHIS